MEYTIFAIFLKLKAKAMAKAIPYDFRIKIIKDLQAGKSCGQIAQECCCTKKAIRALWRAYQSKGEEALRAGYHRCGKHSSSTSEVGDLISSLRNGEQGAPFIVSVLMEKYPDKPIPHERTVQRWWKSQGANRPKGRPPRPKEPFVREAHHTWQIDGKEQIPLKSGQQVTWINIADEASSSDLYAEVFPPAEGCRA